MKRKVLFSTSSYHDLVNTEFNENLTIGQMKGNQKFDGIASASPFPRNERLHALRKKHGFVDHNGKEFKTFSEIQKSTKLKGKAAPGSKILNCLTSRIINEDQKLNYLMLKSGKFRKTDTINQKFRKPLPKESLKRNPFQNVYSSVSESKICWSDKKQSKEMNFNNHGSKFDPINTQRHVKGFKNLDYGDNKLFTKVNGISEFNQITHGESTPLV